MVGSAAVTTGWAYASASEVELNPTDNEDSADVVVQAVVAVDEGEEGVVPRAFALGDNFPNPFNPTTSFTYDLPEAAHVQLVVYNALGQVVRTLVNSAQPAGQYTANWDGRDDVGNQVGSGVYLYRITAGAFSEARRMTLIK